METMDFPQLSDALHRAQIKSLVERYGFDVVIFDPLYRGMSGTDQSDVAARGSVLAEFAQACAPATPIYSHHFTKGAAREQNQIRLPVLEDMTGAGVAEVAGSWVLINRNELWQKDHPHDLSISIGNRDEGGTAIRLLFNEQDWTADVEDWFEFRDGAGESKKRQKVKDKAAKLHEFLRVRMDNPVSKKQIKEGFRINSGTLAELLDLLGRLSWRSVRTSTRAVICRPRAPDSWSWRMLIVHGRRSRKNRRELSLMGTVLTPNEGGTILKSHLVHLVHLGPTRTKVKVGGTGLPP